jgi:hypothetical protein
MKKFNLFFALVFANLFFTNAQQINGFKNETTWMNYWTNFEPFSERYSQTNYTLGGVITSNTTLQKNRTYLLEGNVYVMNNAVLTIEPGTVIRGDFQTCGALVITKGAKIIANGSESDPIVFTSNKEETQRRPGDWGGIILLGDAPINKIGGNSSLDLNLDAELNLYGGSNSESNSGIMKYVRIEYAGRKLSMTKEFNGLSMAGVGSKTVLDHIQISFSNDDSFECYGGKVNLSNVVSFRATDDDFDFTQGVQGDISNSIAIRHPFSSDFSGSRCFEIESYDKIANYDATRNLTRIVANNMVLVNLEDNDQGLVKEAVNISENSYFNFKSSVVSGFSSCVLLQDRIEIVAENLSKVSLQNIIVNNCKDGVASEAIYQTSELKDWLQRYKTTFGIERSQLRNRDLFTNPTLNSTADFSIKNPKNAYITAK